MVQTEHSDATIKCQIDTTDGISESLYRPLVVDLESQYLAQVVERNVH